MDPRVAVKVNGQFPELVDYYSTHSYKPDHVQIKGCAG